MKTAKLPLLIASATLLLATTISCDRGSAPDAPAAAPDAPAAAPDAPAAKSALTSAEMDNLVRRSYQYVALYDTLLGFTFNKKNPFSSGGWNKTHYPQGLMDASVRAIPRPNNDTLYVLSLMDLRKDPVVIHYPGFSSRFVSLETSAMDHYVNIPLATSKGISRSRRPSSTTPPAPKATRVSRLRVWTRSWNCPATLQSRSCA